jgi:hypothetical protein
MSCSGAVVGGRRRKSKRGGDLTEPTPMSTPTPAPTTTGLSAYLPDFLKPKTGGRRITRKAHWRYIRGLKIRLPSRKVKDMGAPGKWASKHGPGIGKLEEGTMMGYTPSKSKTSRHTAIRKAVKRHGALSTFRKLNALSTYTKRTAKGKSKTAKADRNWVKKTFMK